MLFPWVAVRAVSAKIFVKADLAVRSASVGPPGGVNGLTDEENQAALALTNLSADPVKEKAKEQISIFTVMKIVSDKRVCCGCPNRLLVGVVAVVWSFSFPIQAAVAVCTRFLLGL